jgi:hypothetical protein
LVWISTWLCSLMQSILSSHAIQRRFVLLAPT